MAMRLTEEEYDRNDLATLERRLADVENPGRQVPPTRAGQEYRRKLREDIALLQKRVSVGSKG
jgi:hypothetical protein